MLFTFFGQLIYDQKLSVKGLELLVRRDCDKLDRNSTASFLFDGSMHLQQHFYSLDMQVLSHLNENISNIKKYKGLEKVFINLSDEILKEFILCGGDSLPFSTIKVVAEKLHPIQLVVEINENSKIQIEYLKLIIGQLKNAGAMVAQDDFHLGRENFLNLDWDFIKVEEGSSSLPFLLKKNNLIIEHASKDSVGLFKNALYQSFEFHKPEHLKSLFKKTSSEKVFA